ncbi:MAG TPA: VOC family protein [Acidimicrobiia bacterium]
MTDHRPHALDHVVVAVPDLGEAASGLELAGFYVTARSDHPFGTSNRLVMLEGVYIELVSVTRPEMVPESGFARFVKEALGAGRSGPILFAFRSADAQADLERMRSHGLTVPSEPMTFGRQSVRRDGSIRPVEFSVVIPDFGDRRVGSFVCQHLTPDEVWHPSLLDHPNGAARVAAVYVADAGKAEWELMTQVAEAEGPPFRLPNISIDAGPSRLVVEARETGQVEIAGTTVELTVA